MILITHGESYRGRWTKRYKAWVNMHRRCRDLNYHDRHLYGGRDISVCKEWKSYKIFSTDMGEHPGDGWTLDRINNNDDYRPNNCRWALATTQQRNKRNNKLTLDQAIIIRRRRLDGETGPSLAAEYGVTKQMIYRIALNKVWNKNLEQEEEAKTKTIKRRTNGRTPKTRNQNR